MRGMTLSPGRYSGQDNGWLAVFINPHLMAFMDEPKKYPKIPYKPWDERLHEIALPAHP